MAKRDLGISNNFISNVEYDDDTESMTVSFTSGSVATGKVRTNVAQDFQRTAQAGQSVGSFFHANIKSLLTTNG